jgi:CheY-like chemotaxis protein
MSACVYRVLLVDDEPALLAIGKEFLELNGDLQVTTAASGEDALGAITDGQIDVVVSDYQMPKMNGIELLKKIRSSGSGMPFILFTGRGREDVAIDALNNGADFYVRKGTDVEAQFAELRNAIMHLVEMKSINDIVSGIYDAAPMLIMVVDEDRRILTLNRAISEFSSMHLEELIGLRCGVALKCANSREKGCGLGPRCPDCTLLATALRTITEGKTIRRAEVTIPKLTEDGTEDHTLLVSSVPICSFGKRKALLFIEDITDLLRSRTET